MSTDRNDAPEEKAVTKQRMRAALDVLQNYMTDEGKIDATKLTQRIAALESALSLARKERDTYQDAMHQMRVEYGSALACLREVRGLIDRFIATDDIGILVNAQSLLNAQLKETR